MSHIVKNTTNLNILDLIAPHSCRGCNALESVLCERCKNNILSETKTKVKTAPKIYYVGYRNGTLAHLIHDYKYSSTRAIGKKLAELLNETLPDIKGPVIIVPLPTISKHIRERGFDHTYKIAKNFIKLRGKKYQIKKLLIRKNNTVQVGSDRKTRINQAKEAYDIAPNVKIDTSATYILFDDVWTTGASMKTAQKKLHDAGASKIFLSVLAISQQDS